MSLTKIRTAVLSCSLLALIACMDDSQPDYGVASLERATLLYASTVDLDGLEHEMAEWIGQQPTVVNFWSLGCGYCRTETVEFVSLYHMYRKKDVEIVGLAVGGDPASVQAREQVREFADQYGAEWVQLMANQPVSDVFGYEGRIPLTLFFDDKGKLVRVIRGLADHDLYVESFEKIL